MNMTKSYLKELEESFEITKLREGKVTASDIVWKTVTELLSADIFLIEILPKLLTLVF